MKVLVNSRDIKSRFVSSRAVLPELREISTKNGNAAAR